MKLSEIKDDGFKMVNDIEDCEVKAAYTSDLLSDVMGNADEESVLITIQAHKNTVAVACMKDMKAVIICNGREIPADMIEAATDEGVAVFSTDDDQFTASCRIGKLLNV